MSQSNIARLEQMTDSIGALVYVNHPPDSTTNIAAISDQRRFKKLPINHVNCDLRLHPTACAGSNAFGLKSLSFGTSALHYPTV